MKYWLYTCCDKVDPRDTDIYNRYPIKYNGVYKGEHPILYLSVTNRVLLNYWEISENMYNKLNEMDIEYSFGRAYCDLCLEDID